MTKLNKEVQAFYSSCSSDPEAYKRIRYDLLTTIVLSGASINADGTLSKGDCLYNYTNISNLISLAHYDGVKVVVIFSSRSSTNTDSFLSDPTIRTIAINNLLDLVKTYNLDGVDNDIERYTTINSITGLPNKQYMTAFMKELSEKFWSENPNYRISIDVGHKDYQDFWDIPVLQNYVNYIMMMGYDYVSWRYYNNAIATPNAPICPIRDDIRYLFSRMDKKKILLGVPWYGYEWQTVDNTRNSRRMPVDGRYINYSKNVDLVTSKYGRLWDDIWKTPWYTYKDATGQWYQGTYDDPESLGIKYDFVNNEGIAGIGIWNIVYGIDRPEMWQTVEDKFTEKSILPILTITGLLGLTYFITKKKTK